jgi:hypothetical protein
MAEEFIYARCQNCAARSDPDVFNSRFDSYPQTLRSESSSKVIVNYNPRKRHDCSS